MELWVERISPEQGAWAEFRCLNENSAIIHNFHRGRSIAWCSKDVNQKGAS